MGAVKYDGIDDFILFGTPSAVLQAVSTGSKTLISVVHRNVAGAYNGLVTLETSGAAAQTSLEWSTGNFLEVQDGVGSSAGTSTTGPGTNITDVQFVATTKTAAGAPRLIRKNLTTGAAVDRENGASLIGPGSSIGSGGLIRFGMWQGSDPLNGWQIVAAIFNGQLTDAQVDECYATKRTSDIWNCSFGRPVVLIEFNTLTPFDIAGNCVLSSVSAPTLDAAETGAGWTFDGVGGTTFQPRRMPLGV